MYRVASLKSKLRTLPFVFLGVSLLATEGRTSGQDLRVWYDQPAKAWHGGLPIGNGHVGAMVMGAAPRERISLNHTRLWRENRLKDRENPSVAHHLPKIRKMFFEGKIIEASNATHELMGIQPRPSGPDPFQPAGDLFITFFGHDQARNYRRELDLSTGVAKISYRHNGIIFTREVFVSRTDGVLVIRLSADQPGSISAVIELSRTEDADCEIAPWARGNRIGFAGKFIEGVGFATAAEIIGRGGRMQPVSADVAKAEIDGADEVLVLLSLATDKEAILSKIYCETQINRASEDADFDELLKSHAAEHGEMLHRVQLSLGGDTQVDLPTDERFSRLQAGQANPDLMRLVFQYGRYLLISSSRAGGAPANLQGVWNEKLNPPWRSDLHHDCNIQMNYWPAEVTSLSECAEPLYDYVTSLIPAGKMAARNLYGCRGMFVPLTGDPMARCLKTEGLWSEWTGGGPWLAQHLWWHWEWTGNKVFLRQRVYPIYKEMALFYLDYLVKDPRPDSPHYGKLVTVPSQSPENHFVGGVEPVSLCIGAAMDFELIYEVFTNLIEASQELDLDADHRDQWQYVLDNIPPLQIGKHGQLQEWLEDYEESEINHRHISHLYALFPGDQITPERTPKLAKACQVALERRMSGDKGSGWAGVRAWYAACWARLNNGEEAYDLLNSIFQGVRDGRLFAINNGNQQVDGNFAITGALPELLLQSHNGEIKLLPALPKAWPTGHVKGLGARGAFDVDIAWKNGNLTQATITSRIGAPCRIRTQKTLSVQSKNQKIQTRRSESGVIEFNTQSGKSYVLTMQN